MDFDVLENTNGRSDFELYIDKTSLSRSIDQIIEEITQSHEKENPINFNRYRHEICSILMDYPKASTLGKLFRLCNLSSSILHLVIKSFRYVFRNCHFDPGDTLMFPQFGLSHLQIDQNAIHLLQFETRAAGSFLLDRSLGITISNGMTISTWIRIALSDILKRQHILSIGCCELKLMAELCRDLRVVRVSVMHKNIEIFKVSFPNVVTIGGPWVNFSMGMQYTTDQLSLFIMLGNHHRVIQKNVKINVKMNSLFQVSIGTSITAKEKEFCIYQISTIFAFKGLLTPEHALLLRSLGSACFSLTECRISQIYSSFLQCFGRPVMNSTTCDVFQVCSDSARFLNKLQKILLFTWRPCSAHCYSLNILQKGVDYISSLDYNDSTLCLSTSRDLLVYWFTTILQERCESIDKSLRTIGSVKIFIFLYALTVDINASEEIQTEAFRLLFLCLKRDSFYYEMFNQLDGASILVLILSNRNARMSLTMCQEILNYVFTKLEIRSNGELYPTPRTAIAEPNFLRTIIGSSEIWQDYKFEFWFRILCVTNESLSNNEIPNCFIFFNYKQLVQTQFLHQLLQVMLDMFQNHSLFIYTAEEKSPNHSCVSSFENLKTEALLTHDIAFIISNLCTELIGSPYRSDAVIQLWNFILLSHPAQDTYFDYSTRNHNEWIRHDLIDPGDEPNVIAIFDLPQFFEKIVKEHTERGITSMWTESNMNIIEFRYRLMNNVYSNTTVVTKPERFTFCRMNSVDYSPILRPPIVTNEINNETTQNKSSENYVNNKENKVLKHWLVETRARLLSVMSNVILNCEDSLMAVIELDVIYWQTIFVLLSNQKHKMIRTLTFTLLKNFFLRCSPIYRQNFVAKQGFLLLGNELKKGPVNSTIGDALFSLACGEHVFIRDGLDSSHLENIIYDSFKLSSFYALFALLEESIYDSGFFWSVCSTLQKMFMADNAPRSTMLDSGLVSTMANVLWKICFSDKCPPIDSPMFSLLDCWISFAQSIIAFCVPYKDNHNYFFCEDLLWLCLIAAWQSHFLWNLNYVNCTNKSNEPPSKTTSYNSLSSWSDERKNAFFSIKKNNLEAGIKAIRKALCQLIYCWIDTIQSILADQIKPSQNLSVSNHVIFGGSLDDSDYEIMGEEEENPWPSFYTHYSNKLKPNDFALLEEMAGRLLFGMNMAQNFFFHLSLPEKCSDQEETLFRYYIDIVSTTLKRPQKEKLSDEWNSVLVICREKSRILLAELVAFILYPAHEKLNLALRHNGAFKNFKYDDTNINEIIKNQTKDLVYLQLYPQSNNIEKGNLLWSLKRRMIIIRFLAKQDRYYMESLLDVNLDYQYAMNIALHELALLPNLINYYKYNEFDVELDRLIKFLTRIQIKTPLSNLTKSEICSLASDELILIHSYYKTRNAFCQQIASKAVLMCEKENSSAKFTTDTAMTLTCEIAEFQNVPRKLFIQWRKALTNDLAKAGNTLENFIREFFHPHGTFFDSRIWPIGRALETTESSCRERRRLTPSHYQFSPKFLHKEHKTLVEKINQAKYPLMNILNNFKNYKSLDHVEAINQVRLSISAILLRTVFECSGEIVVSDKKLYFLGEQAKSTQKGVSYAPVTYSFKYEQIREIQFRFYLLKDTALELFTTTGDAFLIFFATTEDRNTLVSQLQSMNLSQLFVDPKIQLHAATDKWRNEHLTNFEYLMFLNKLAGRSFNDMMQYPVFPFILSNYTSSVLDLNSDFSYRDLSKPMAIQDSKMESVYIQSYNNLLEEFKKNNDNFYSSNRFGAYHYGSHYSNTGIVAYFLVRVSPFTNVALEYQDNNFDIADRLFNSIETTWRLSSSESTTDFKELIPEFFFFPEMFQNLEKLDLGVRQAGQRVENVSLPPWCPRENGGSGEEGDPRLFCLINRQALESNIVTSTLNYWIDLIFGYKQSNDSAVKSINVFHPATYRGRDLESENLSDELAVSAIRTMVRTYGQMPSALFSSPHLPHLNVGKKSIQTSISTGTLLTITKSTLNVKTNIEVSNFVFDSVIGLRWGLFCGSPEINSNYLKMPSFTFQVNRSENIDHLIGIINKDETESCYGVPLDAELIFYYKSNRKDVLRRSYELLLSAIISWRFADNVLRIKLLQKADIPWINLIDMQSLQLSKVAFSPSNCLLYLGFKCGLIRVYSLNYLSENVSFHRRWSIKLRSELIAHECKIMSLQVSDEFHVLLSASLDGKICIWDTNRLEFISVLTRPPHTQTVDETVTLSCISPTSADICICFQSGRLSRVALYTINGVIVGVHEEDQTVTSLVMTNIAEGTGINCLAIGLVSGVIKILDMWTMNIVQKFSFDNLFGPITSLLYTTESQRLYVVVFGRLVLCFQIPSLSSGRSKAPFFKFLNPFT